MKRPGDLSSRIVKNSAWNFGAYFSYLLVTFLSTPIYIRYLGVSQYGLLALLSTTLAPLALLNFGFGQATIKYVAESAGSGNYAEAKTFVGTTLLFNLCVGVIGAILIGIAAPTLVNITFRIDPALHGIATRALLWIAIGWLFDQVSATFSGVPVALQKYGIASVGQAISNICNVVLSVVVLVLGGDLLVLIECRVAWSFVVSAAWFIVARKLLPGTVILPRYEVNTFRRSFHFGVWQTIGGIGGLLANYSDRIILGIYVSAEAVGLFSIPSAIMQATFGVVGKFGEVLFPAFSVLDGKGEKERAARIMLRSTWLLSLLMVSIAGSLVVMAKDALRLYVGREISESSTQVLMIFAFTAVLSSPSIGVTQYLLGMGRTRWTAITSISSGIATLGASLVLVPKYGLMGAAWSDLFAIVLSRPAIHYMIWRKYLNVDISFRETFSALYSPALVGGVTACLLALLKRDSQIEPGWVGLILMTCCCMLVLSVAIIGFEAFFPWGAQRRADCRTVAYQMWDITRSVILRRG